MDIDQPLSVKTKGFRWERAKHPPFSWEPFWEPCVLILEKWLNHAGFASAFRVRVPEGALRKSWFRRLRESGSGLFYCFQRTRKSKKTGGSAGIADPLLSICLVTYEFHIMGRCVCQNLRNRLFRDAISSRATYEILLIWSCICQDPHETRALRLRTANADIRN